MKKVGQFGQIFFFFKCGQIWTNFPQFNVFSDLVRRAKCRGEQKKSGFNFFYFKNFDHLSEKSIRDCLGKSLLRYLFSRMQECSVDRVRTSLAKRLPCLA